MRHLLERRQRCASVDNERMRGIGLTRRPMLGTHARLDLRDDAFGFFSPAGTPKPIIDKFYRDVVAAVREEANYNTFVNKFRSEVPLPTPNELRHMIVEELPFWAKIIRDNNIKGGA